MKLLTVYLVMGMVWCIIGLPTLLSKSNNSAIRATGLALFRIIAWPVLAGKAGYKVIQDNKETKDEEATESTD